jgi:hypothetical protein
MAEIMEMKRTWQTRLETMPEKLTVVTHHVKYYGALHHQLPPYLAKHFADDQTRDPDVLLYIGCIETKESIHKRYNLPGKIVEYHGKQCKQFIDKIDQQLFLLPKLL